MEGVSATGPILGAKQSSSARLVRRYKHPENLGTPLTERDLPRSLSSTSCKITISHSKRHILLGLTNALVSELLQLDSVGETQTLGEVGTADSEVCTAIEKMTLTPEMEMKFMYQKLEMVTLTKPMKKNMRSGNIHNAIKNCVHFCAFYEQLIREVVGPHILAEFLAEKEKSRENKGESMAGDAQQNVLSENTRCVLYQFPPTVRIYCSHLGRKDLTERIEPLDFNSMDPPEREEAIEEEQKKWKTLGKLHNDAEFGHQGGEFNFWMPFVPTDITSTLWAETVPGKGDFYPFHPLEPGEVMRFPGTFCRHFAKANISGKTRVSIDFRCSVSSCFDPAYLGRAIMGRRHIMKEMKFGPDLQPLASETVVTH